MLRGDTARISIGKNTQIQDNTQILNSDTDNPNMEIVIGDNVVIGKMCFNKKVLIVISMELK